MKKIVLLLACTCIFSCSHSRHNLVKQWENTDLKTPESVIFAEAENCYFVSCIDGKPDVKDSLGSIAKIGINGKTINAGWISGLNAPKGMCIFHDTLYVTDITEVVVIDIKKSVVVRRITIDSSIFLNDITIDGEGTVFVSDTRKGRITAIRNGKPQTMLNNLPRPNGLLFKDSLYYLDNGSLYKYSNDGSKSLCTGMDASTDGLAALNEKEFIVSCWAGITYYINERGEKEILFDHRAKK